MASNVEQWAYVYAVASAWEEWTSGQLAWLRRKGRGDCELAVQLMSLCAIERSLQGDARAMACKDVPVPLSVRWRTWRLRWSLWRAVNGRSGLGKAVALMRKSCADEANADEANDERPGDRAE